MKRPLNPELLLEHLEWMRRLARSLVRDETVANDVVQQTLLMALERPPRNQDAAPSWCSGPASLGSRVVGLNEFPCLRL